MFLKALGIFAVSLSLAYADLAPKGPWGGIWDPSARLSAEAQATVSDLLEEHRAATGDDVRVVIYEYAQKDAPGELERLFQRTQVGARSLGRGVLIALDPVSQTGALIFGLGYDEDLAVGAKARIPSTITQPWLRTRQIDEATINTTLALLRVLESPVIASGRWKDLSEQTLSTQTVSMVGLDRGVTRSFSSTTLVIGVSLSALLFAIALGFQLGAEAHFSEHGWVRYRPWLAFFSRRIEASPPEKGLQSDWRLR